MALSQMNQCILSQVKKMTLCSTVLHNYLTMCAVLAYHFHENYPLLIHIVQSSVDFDCGHSPARFCIYNSSKQNHDTRYGK